MGTNALLQRKYLTRSEENHPIVYMAKQKSAEPADPLAKLEGRDWYAITPVLERGVRGYALERFYVDEGEVLCERIHGPDWFDVCRGKLMVALELMA